ncbi:MAG: sarcosine oxidase subunit alpha family protein [Paracoccaceae bacterium]|jgi:heterotetrameric sarcosine oxidase alpha subunit
MSQSHRLSGGLIDRSASLNFIFDGKSYQGYAGDTLASALLANGQCLMGRSFKYHRPRGPISAGSEEPNAIVELREGARLEPNTRATVAELFDGLVAKSQNRWPTLKFDAMAITDLLHPFLAAGFYYKTFMWPATFWEKIYEPIIRRAAGLGSLSKLEDPDFYDKGFLHCDLLVIGAGPAGLSAALTAGRAGARVILADEDFLMGGRLNSETYHINDMGGALWAAEAIAELSSLPNVRLLARTTVLGAFDHGIYSAVERVSDHVLVPADNKSRQTLWRIYSQRALLATGAIERPIAFENNDRPGIMMAASLRSYANRWATAVGKRVAIFTNNDDGLRSAIDLKAKGVEIAAVIDTRSDGMVLSDMRHIKSSVITDTKGRLGVSKITIRHENGIYEELSVDAVGVTGGWNPNVNINSHHRGRPRWDDQIVAFLPSPDGPKGLQAVGAAAGHFSTHQALETGQKGAIALLADLGIKAKAVALPKAEDSAYAIKPYWFVPYGKGRAWVDTQNDVTIKDIKLAHRENFTAVEHLKRYTTLGMATDQGKTSNVLGLAVMASLTNKTIEQTGSTIFRPPYTPVAFGALAGRARGPEFKPTRLPPSHKWAAENGAVFVEVGMWMRTQWLTQVGETHWRQSVDREVLTTRNSAGICDVTTLGKIDIQGADVATFLNRVYANAFAALPVGKCRYGLMLREDGIVFDDGTTARLGKNEYVMTTTTANAVTVYRHLEFCRQCLWPDLDVQLISTTEAWAQYSVAGPNARRLLQKLVDQDISNEAFPYMGASEITVCDGVRARLFRISFSGELAFEIAIPTRYGDAMIRALVAAGEEFDACVYGTEALGVMRIEKGHVAGNELDGRSTALNMGLGKMVSQKSDSIGMLMSQREGLAQLDGLRLVGVRPVNAKDTISAGSHFMLKGAAATLENDDGWVTSAAYSPTLGCPIALGYLKNGATRMGEKLRAVNFLTKNDVEVEIVSPHFVDPEGARLRA